MADISTWNLAEIKQDVIRSQRESAQRGLLQSAKWYVTILPTSFLSDVNYGETLKPKLLKYRPPIY